MAENTIKALAIEYAGAFYGQKRSDRFRSKDSLTRAKRLTQDAATGQMIEIDVIVPFFEAYPDAATFAIAHWPLFYEAARKSLVAMLAMPEARINTTMKDAIAAALIEDRQKEYRTGGRRLIQGVV